MRRPQGRILREATPEGEDQCMRANYLTALAALGIACLASRAGHAAEPSVPDAAALAAMSARFAPFDVRVDLTALPQEERRALARLIEASRYVDALFMRQRWAGNDPLLLQLSADQSQLGRARLGFFLLNKGPWSELDENR